jgi:hypothetical protein
VVERAGVVDEDVDRAELLDDARDGRIDLDPIGDVALQRERAPAEPADLLRRGLGVDEALRPRSLREHAVARGVLARIRLELDVGERDVRPGPRQSQRIRAPEPARPSRDERDAPRQVDLERHAPKPKQPSDTLSLGVQLRGRKISLAITRR